MTTRSAPDACAPTGERAPPPLPPRQNAPPMAGVPRPVRFGASGAAATAARAPSPSPPLQNAPSTAGVPRPVRFGASGAAVTAARAPSPCPHPLQNAPSTAGVGRPVRLGASGAAATAARTPSPSPPVQNAPSTAGARMQGAPPREMTPVPTMKANAQGKPMAMSRGNPTTPYANGAAIPTGNPHAQQLRTQGASVARNPVPTSSRAMGVPIRPAQPHAPLPHHGGAGEPARGMPPSTSGATHRMPALPPPLWQAAAAAAAAMPPSLSQAHGTVHHPFPYDGVKQDAFTGKWAATVFDPDLNDVRLAGAFPDEHTAALAHDRLDIAFHSDRARVNFKPAFHDVELQFLRRCRAKKNVFDICAIVGDGTYDEHYAKFLSTLYQQAMYHSGARSFTNVILDFFICRASEIWREADDAGDEKLAERFVDMHKNKATNPRWREWYHRKVAQQHPQQLQGAAVNKRKADDEDDQQHKRQLLRTQQQE